MCSSHLCARACVRLPLLRARVLPAGHIHWSFCLPLLAEGLGSFFPAFPPLPPCCNTCPHDPRPPVVHVQPRTGRLAADPTALFIRLLTTASADGLSTPATPVTAPAPPAAFPSPATFFSAVAAVAGALLPRRGTPPPTAASVVLPFLRRAALLGGALFPADSTLATLVMPPPATVASPPLGLPAAQPSVGELVRALHLDGFVVAGSPLEEMLVGTPPPPAPGLPPAALGSARSLADAPCWAGVLLPRPIPLPLDFELLLRAARRKPCPRCGSLALARSSSLSSLPPTLPCHVMLLVRSQASPRRCGSP